MIRVNFSPNRLSPEQKQWFHNWCRLAEGARQRLANDPQLQPKIWGTLKQWLLKNFFHGKCAYCEIKITAGFVGDAEHYRPKGAVTETNNDGKMVYVERNGQRHRGYNWLAYDWRNLVPSCERCNAVHGKRTQFPIAGSRVFDEALGPDTETLNRLERPLLLHPYPDGPDDLDDPANHIVFAPDGKVVGLDEKGKKSIAVLDLNREDLVNLRLWVIALKRTQFGRELENLVADAKVTDISAKVDQALLSLTSADQMFSAATRDVLNVIRINIRPVSNPAAGSRKLLGYETKAWGSAHHE